MGGSPDNGSGASRSTLISSTRNLRDLCGNHISGALSSVRWCSGSHNLTHWSISTQAAASQAWRRAGRPLRPPPLRRSTRARRDRRRPFLPSWRRSILQRPAPHQRLGPRRAGPIVAVSTRRRRPRAARAARARMPSGPPTASSPQSPAPASRTRRRRGAPSTRGCRAAARPAHLVLMRRPSVGRPRRLPGSMRKSAVPSLAALRRLRPRRWRS